nr:hypothetical protein [Kiritimatiellia bacterium]
MTDTRQSSLFDDDEEPAPRPARGKSTPPSIPAASKQPVSDSDIGDGPLRRLMDGNFLQYASYVIRDRAIPELADGLKPVQRRILHALHEKDDGRFIKVANIVGHTMQY